MNKIEYHKEVDIMKGHQIEILELKSTTKVKNLLQEFNKIKQIEKESTEFKCPKFDKRHESTHPRSPTNSKQEKLKEIHVEDMLQLNCQKPKSTEAARGKQLITCKPFLIRRTAYFS